MIIAGLPSSETVFEYLTGCWKRLYAANKELHRSSYDKKQWQQLFDRLKSLIISYCGLTLEDPTMFPQPNRPTGPAEFLPLLLSLSDDKSDLALAPSELLPFLNDLATHDVLADVLTPTFSLFFQQWFSISPTPDITGQDWRRYLGAVALMVQVKPIAALVSILSSMLTIATYSGRVDRTRCYCPKARMAILAWPINAPKCIP